MARGILRLVRIMTASFSVRPRMKARGRSELSAPPYIPSASAVESYPQRIVERLQVQVYLVFHVAGKETEFLTRLHGRAGKDYLAAQLVLSACTARAIAI